MGASYDNQTGVAELWHDGKMVKSRNIGQIQLRTQFPIRLGADSRDKRQFKGKISCVQIYDRALTAEQVGSLRHCPVEGRYSHVIKSLVDLYIRENVIPVASLSKSCQQVVFALLI